MSRCIAASVDTAGALELRGREVPGRRVTTMANEEMKDIWEGNADLWVRLSPVFDSVFEPVTEVLTGTLSGLEARERVLDVGCGSGTLLAAVVERGAAAVGVDISPPMAEGARARVPEAEVLVADAQTADLLAVAPGGPFARVISRFGVMFFSDSQAAFANIRSAAATGAPLTFMCWRSRDENPMFTQGITGLLARLDPPPPPPVPGSPGPNAFADPDRVRALLEGAGWEGVSIEPFDFTLDFSKRGGDGVEERLAVILGNEGGRMAQEQLEQQLGADGWESVLEELRAELRESRVDGAISFPGACWLVHARNPGT